MSLGSKKGTFVLNGTIGAGAEEDIAFEGTATSLQITNTGNGLLEVSFDGSEFITMEPDGFQSFGNNELHVDVLTVRNAVSGGGTTYVLIAGVVA